jgi:hypothetical protein
MEQPLDNTLQEMTLDAPKIQRQNRLNAQKEGRNERLNMDKPLGNKPSIV